MYKIIISIFLFLNISYANSCCEHQVITKQNNLNVLFKSNSYKLTDNGTKNIYNYADYLFENCDLTIVLEAHTDSVGAQSENMNLSLKRANSVKEYLISLGILDERIKIVGYGEDKPKVSNILKNGRQINRRVTARIVEQR